MNAMYDVIWYRPSKLCISYQYATDTHRQPCWIVPPHCLSHRGTLLKVWAMPIESESEISNEKSTSYKSINIENIDPLIYAFFFIKYSVSQKHTQFSANLVSYVWKLIQYSKLRPKIIKLQTNMFCFNFY
jgi:hypothetical protein